MTERGLVHESRFTEFQKWLERDGWEVQQPKGAFEVFRARKIGKREPVIFYQRMNSQHITAFGIGVSLARQFVRERKSLT